MIMQRVSDEYANQELIVKPGDRLHRVVAMLFDTYYDDITDERLAEIEKVIESFRWMNASGERVDNV
jgi:hypothetical protein